MKQKSWVFVSLFLYGCQLNPPYTPPMIDVPVQWHSRMSEDSTSCEDPSYFLWWQSLEDPLLESLIVRAKQNNLDLSIAGIRILETRQERMGIKSQSLPHIDGSITGGHLYCSKEGLVDGVLKTLFPDCHHHKVKRNVNFFEIGFDADWEIDLFGANKHAAHAVDAKIEMAEEALYDIWITLSAEIARNYIELRSFQQQLTIIEENIEIQKESIYLLQQLEIIGDVSAFDLLAPQEQLQMAAAQKTVVYNQIQRVIHRLSILVGSFPDSLFCELSLVQSLPSLPQEKPIGLPSELLRRRPDIRKAERNVAAASETLSSSIAALFPRLSLYGFIGNISTQLHSLPNSASTTWFGAPQLLFPIFNSRLLTQDVKWNKLETRIALFEYQKTVLLALEEVENGISTFTQEEKRNQHLLELRNIHEESSLLTFDLYQRGIVGYLEVLNKRQALLNAENTLLQGQEKLILSYISLYKALGGGWCTDQ